jgi:hypothetical protein
LLAFAGALVALAGLRSAYLTADGVDGRVKQLRIGTCVMAAMAWAIVLIGVWMLLPWYGEDTPGSPRSRLLADPSTRQWHEFADDHRRGSLYRLGRPREGMASRGLVAHTCLSGGGRPDRARPTGYLPPFFNLIGG